MFQLAAQFLGGSAFAQLLKATPPAFTVDQVARPAAGAPAAGTVTHARRYRVDATVGLLNIPIISKQGVGGGIIVLEQVNGGAAFTTGIQLAAGSWPGKLRGFNRFGMTQEATRKEEGSVAESAYMSFMTSSPEKSFHEARSAYESRSNSMTFSVAHGRSTPVETAAGVEKISTPANYTWADAGSLIGTLREKLAQPMQPAPEAKSKALLTFLCACRESLLQGPGTREVAFAHNSKIYSLKSQVTQSDADVVLSGTILLNGRAESQFRAWFQKNDPLPRKFEFRPKNYLKLTFEHDPAASGPSFRTLFHQEPV